MDIPRLLRYSDLCRAQMRETLLAHPDTVNAPFPTIGAYKTIAGLLAHITGAEERWLHRLEDRPQPSRYEERAAPDLDGIYSDWDSLRARLHAYVNAHPALPSRSITFTLPQWNTDTLSLTDEEILFHLVNHQTWHFAQISMALQFQNIDPPNFDYPLL